MMHFLRRWLEEWTPERAASNAYKFLLLDVARGHLAREIVDLVWSYGYFTMYHNGGIPSVLQVNGIDLHAFSSKMQI